MEHRTPGDTMMSEHREASSRNARATSSESACIDAGSVSLRFAALFRQFSGSVPQPRLPLTPWPIGSVASSGHQGL